MGRLSAAAGWRQELGRLLDAGSGYRGAGYIGSHTVKELLREGYAVTVLDNLSGYGDLEAIIRTAWAWHRQHPQGYAEAG